MDLRLRELMIFWRALDRHQLDRYQTQLTMISQICLEDCSLTIFSYSLSWICL